MSKINNKLILTLGILTFILGLPLVSSANTRGDAMISAPNYYYNYSNPTGQYNYTPVVYNNSPVYGVPIPGCEGRNTGYSMTTGQSCVGNYIAPAPTPTPVAPVQSSETTTTTVSKTTDTSNTDTVAASDVNDSYGSLTANALVGSNSFMPNGLLQWIFFVLLIAVIIFLWRYIHNSKEEYMLEPMKHA